jgi:hypothetical protein
MERVRRFPSLESELESLLVFIFHYTRSTIRDTADPPFSVIDDKSPLPTPGATEEEDAILLQDEAYIDGTLTSPRYCLLFFRAELWETAPNYSAPKISSHTNLRIGPIKIDYGTNLRHIAHFNQN